jgi:ankyrin repeat protein
MHAVCADPRSSRAQVQLVAEFFPASLVATDSRGALPLHWACRTLKHDTVEFLIEQYPESLRCEDDTGSLALHWACCGEKDDSIDTIQYLVAKYPAAIEQLTKRGALPVHVAMCSTQSLNTLWYLMREYPQFLQCRNDNIS